MKRVDIISKVVGRDGQGKPVGGGISIPMGNYALKSDFESLKSMFNDFLEGDDTDSVINRWKDLEAFLNGISEDNTLDSILKAYVTLSGNQTITGEKNFVGGMKVNGSPIYYDTEKKYWKLEGDLLVTGGVTMYGNEGTFTPSTIMDAIVVDGTTISKEGGILKVIGSVGGVTTLGTLANVGSWADSVASQDRIMYQAANSSQWIAKNLSDLAVGGTTGNYLPLSGGVMTGWIGLPKGTAIYDGNTYTLFGFNTSGDDLLVGHNLYNLTIRSYDTTIQTRGDSLRHYNINTGVTSTILDSDNYSSYALPLSGGTLTGNLTFGVANNTSYYDIDLSRNGNFIKISNTTYKLLLEYKYQSYATYHGLMVDEYGVHYTQRTDLEKAPTKYTLWHTGNDGSGSGLDADLLDGLDAIAFFYDKGASNSFDDKIYNGAYRTSSFKPNNAYGYGLVASFRSMETCAQIYFPDSNGEPQFRMQWNSQTSITSGWTALVTSSSIGNYNAGSATKLATPRTIWGQSFDGTGNVSGFLENANFIMSNNKDGYFVGNRKDGVGSSDGGLLLFSYANNPMSLFTNSVERIRITPTGDVGIGTTIPAYKLDIVGQCRSQFMYFFNYDWNGNAGYIGRGSNGNNRIILYAESDDVYIFSKGVLSTVFTGANMLVQGGITMYSARKLKTIQDERGLSLEELSVIKPTRFTWKDGRDNKIHIGGIADDVMKVLPEVIYKTGEDDTLTMDYGNAAFAIAASLIKPVISHEERIKVLEEENKRLKEEVEQLKWNIA